MKFLIALLIALSITIVWQTNNLRERADHLKSVDHKEMVTIPPQAS